MITLNPSNNDFKLSSIVCIKNVVKKIQIVEIVGKSINVNF